MYPTFNPYPQLQLPQPTPSIQYVNGKASADAYQMSPNCSVLLMDSTCNRFYIKKTDASGMATVHTYEFEEVSDEHNTGDYVTREEFEEFKAELKPNTTVEASL